MKIQKRAGHSDFSTTQIYINLAGETPSLGLPDLTGFEGLSGKVAPLS